MSAPSVPLPRRLHNQSATLTNNQPPVWAVSDSVFPEDAPLPIKCARHEGHREGVCCKELKDADERHLIDPDVVRDV